MAGKHQPEADYAQTLKRVVSPSGWDLESLSNDAPTLAVFLRHLGCVYCRESLAELERLRPQIEDNGVRIALVHMGSDEQGKALLQNFGLDDLVRFSDPDRRLYAAFGLERMTMGGMLNPRTLIGMIKTGFTSKVPLRRSVGRVVGDSLQMPGVFLIRDGRIVGDFRPDHLSEHADYLEMAALEC